jgi:alpha-galactosidase
MSAKIVIIGAGSGFGGKLSIDVLSRQPLRDAQIVLVDIDAKKLDAVQRYLKRFIEHHKLPARIDATLDRNEALPGADFVITSVSVGGPAYAAHPYKGEVEIPNKYGVVQTVADTIGPGGIFRFLRTGPVQLAFCRDIERHCPDALLINYTNPMCMLTWLHSTASSVANVGLCHSVQHTSHELAGYVGVPREDVRYRVAGINHQAWFLEFRSRDGEDLYPRLREAMAKEETYNKDKVRFEMMRHFGYFVTESSRHNSEYLPYFNRTPETRAHFGYETRQVPDAPKNTRDWLANPDTVAIPPIGASLEYASAIIEAKLTNVPFRFNGNVMNAGLIDNLPDGCCVEVPCLVDANGVQPCHVGDLPPQCAALNRTNVSVQELAVKAVVERDRDAAYHAVALDPLTAATVPLPKIRQMFDEMWENERELLTHFER